MKVPEQARKFVGQLFGLSDGLQVSKPRLVIAVCDLWFAMNQLRVELFFLNPNHPTFEKISDDERDALTKAVAERKS